MIKPPVLLRIHDLLDNGQPVAEIAERLDVSVSTVYNCKRRGRPVADNNQPQAETYTPVALAPFKGLVDQHAKSGRVKQNTLFFMLQAAGYQGSRSTFDRYYRQRRVEQQPTRYLKHIETGKGEQAQVDWGHFGVVTINGKREKAYLFAYTLSYSRAAYYEFVVRQNQRTLQLCHIHAFEKLGIPKTIYYDNMKTVVSNRQKLADGQVKVNYNLAFLDFARYYRFQPIASPPYWPQTKGKIERNIRYVRRYFSRATPKVAITLKDWNDRLAIWTDQQANQRIHGTTHQKPYERWFEEKPELSFPTNIPSYDCSPIKTYHTTEYGLLRRNGVTYNLGPTYARIRLAAREVQDHGLPLLELYRHNELLMSIPIPSQKHVWVSVNSPNSQPSKTIETAKETKQPARKEPLRYDIAVEKRSLSYYGIMPVLTEEVTNG